MALPANTKPSLEAKSKLDVAKNWEKSTDELVKNVDKMNAQMQGRIDTMEEHAKTEEELYKIKIDTETKQYREFGQRFNKKKNEMFDSMWELIGRSGPLGAMALGAKKLIGGVFELFAGSREERQQKKLDKKSKKMETKKVAKFIKTPAGQIRSKALEAAKIQGVTNKKLKTNPMPVFDRKVYALMKKGAATGGGAIGSKTDRILTTISATNLRMETNGISFQEATGGGFMRVEGELQAIRAAIEAQGAKKKGGNMMGLIILAVLGVVAVITGLMTFLKPTIDKLVNFIKPIIKKIGELLGFLWRMFDKYIIRPIGRFLEDVKYFFASDEEKKAIATESYNKVMKEFDDQKQNKTRIKESVNAEIANQSETLGSSEIVAGSQEMKNLARGLEDVIDKAREHNMEVIRVVKRKGGTQEEIQKVQDRFDQEERAIRKEYEEKILEVRGEKGITGTRLSKDQNKNQVVVKLDSLLRNELDRGSLGGGR